MVGPGRATLMVAAALVGWTGAAQALPRDVRLSQLASRRLSVDVGLPQPLVHSIAQTADRILWVGTQGGLARFDGFSFQAFTPRTTPAFVSQGVGALLVDPAGTLLIATAGGGLVTFRDGRFAAPAPGGPPEGANELMLDRAGTLWSASFSGVFRRSRNGRTQLAEGTPAAAWTACEDSTGTVWAGGVGGGLFRWRADRFERVDLPARIGQTGIRALRPDGPALWVGTDGAGLLRLEGDKIRLLDRADGLPDDHVATLLRDRAGTLWIGTQRGLVRLFGARLETFPAGEELASEPIEALLEDDEGSLWVGTRTAGLVHLSRGRLTALDQAEGLPSRRVISVGGGADGDLWIGTRGDGVVHWQGGRFTQTKVSEGLCTNEVWTILVDRQGGVWVGGVLGPAERNLCRLRAGQWETILPGAAEGPPGVYFEVRALLEDRSGTVWVGGGALHRVRGSKLEIVDPPLPGNVGNINALAEDPAGDLWVAAKRGVHRLVGGARWQSIDRAGGLDAPVLSIHLDADGTPWLGTNRGLAVNRDGKVFFFTPEHGVPDDAVYKILEDDARDLWLGTPKGLLRVSRERLTEVASGFRPRVSAVLYGRTDGMKSDQVDGTPGRGSGHRSPDGRLWFATGQGVAAVEPPGTRAAAAVPSAPVVIDALLLNGMVSTPTNGGWRIPTGPRNVEIRFARPTFIGPEKVRFRYRLSGVDAGWVDAGTRRSAFYTGLPPGHHLFTAAAEIPDGAPPRPATVELDVDPFLHETWLFRVLVLAGLAGLGWLVHRRRLARQASRHQAVLAERGRIARELHDTLAQGFTGIALHLEAALKRLGSSPDRAVDSLRQAKALANQSLVEARSAVWDLRAAAGDHRAVISALTDTARALGSEIPVRLQINGRPFKLKDEAAQVLVRVGQESITNAIRHAQATDIAISLSFEDAGVELRIEDDGRGFAPEGPSAAGHFGLQGMHERVASLGGTLTVDSRPGAGTRVSVILAGPPPAGREWLDP